MAGHNGRQRRLYGLADVDREQQWVDPSLWVIDQPLQRLARLQALVRQRGGLAVYSHEKAHLRHRGEDEHDQQHQNDNDHHEVDVGELAAIIQLFLPEAFRRRATPMVFPQ